MNRDPLYRNWFVVYTRDDCHESSGLRGFGREPRRLTNEVADWLAANSKIGHVVEFPNHLVLSGEVERQCFVCKQFCRVLFRSQKEATLFQMFWGGETPEDG